MGSSTVTSCKIVFLVFSIISVSTSGAKAQTLKANIHMNGVRAMVTFQPNSVDSSIIEVQLEGEGSHTVEIYSNPIVYDVADKCASLGPSVADLGLMSVGMTQTLNAMSFFGQDNSIAGRSVLITSSDGTNTTACGTIETDQTQNAMATFREEVTGVVYLRQQNTTGSPYWTALADLFFTDGSTAARSYDLYHDDTCSVDGGLLIGALEVGGDLGSARSTLVNTATNLNDMAGKVLVLRPASPVVPSDGNVVCTAVRMVQARTVVSHVSMVGVQGTFTFSQASPLDVTTVAMKLRGLASRATTYHVHNYPVPQRLSKEDDLCSAASVSGHWNPYGVDVNASPPGGTHDEFEVGDLSGKFGALTNLTEIERVSTDYNLPLFGENSIVGRSVVIHNVTHRMACASIGYPGPVVTAVANFQYPMIGQLVFRQLENDPESETTVFASLQHADGASADTLNHNFHVHTHRVGPDFLQETGRCQSAEGHYNPTNVDLMATYQTGCRPGNQLRCEVGDLSGKHGPVTVGKDGTYARAFWTSLYLPLTDHTVGTETIKVTGLSVTIHDPELGGGRYSCANVDLVRPTVATANEWKVAVRGAVTFKETPTGVTALSKSLTGLRGIAGGYHVHTLGINPHVQAPCSPDSVSGHFVPFDWPIAASPEAGTGSVDQYEVGDLSGKNGMLTGKTSATTNSVVDNNLYVTGVQAVVGRSVVIHREEDGSRWDCSDIIFDAPAMGGEIVAAEAMFDDFLTGYVRFEQVVYPDGTHSDTVITIDLSYSSDSDKKTNEHNWHVHELPVGVDTPTSACASTGGHYNPFMAPISEDRYRMHCNMRNPSYCELGDLSKRLSTYDIGGGVEVFTDVDSPLVGNFSFLGRSIVFHEEDKAAPRLACADIIATRARMRSALTFTSTEAVDKVAIRDLIADFLQTDTWNVAVSNTTDKYSDCSEVTVTFTGKDRMSLYERFEADKADLEGYSHDDSLCTLSSLTSSAGLMSSSFVLLALAVALVSALASSN